MFFVAGTARTARRAVQTWVPSPHGSLGLACLGWSRAAATREIRTKAFLRKRTIAPTGQAGSDEAETAPVRVASQAASTPSLGTHKLAASRTDERLDTLDDSGPSFNTKDTTTKPEKASRKLEAFPFVPRATPSELAKAHKFFFLPTVFVKSATSLAMVPENTAIPEVNKMPLTGLVIQKGPLSFTS
ncbi:MAG: hypothetical protein J3Q66DRAFT_349234 [Benniella sp.]|nr:MAG: hypothetical protein J3Q66DRAFT_349234 [Benniella sp.]